MAEIRKVGEQDRIISHGRHGRSRISVSVLSGLLPVQGSWRLLCKKLKEKSCW